MKRVPVCGIYLIRHVESGRCYVGQSIDIEARLVGLATRRNRHHLSKMIAELGWSAFATEVLEQCPREALDASERKWIAELETIEPAGLNRATGGVQSFALSQAACKRISHGLTGLPKSPEWRALMSERQKNNPANSARMTELARHQSAETREKIAASKRGKKASPETCAKISAARKARHRLNDVSLP